MPNDIYRFDPHPYVRPHVTPRLTLNRPRKSRRNLFVFNYQVTYFDGTKTHAQSVATYPSMRQAVTAMFNFVEAENFKLMENNGLPSKSQRLEALYKESQNDAPETL